MDDYIVYQQDAEFCRYQDKLRWSRFQTAALIEAGLTYVSWVEPQKFGRVSSVMLTFGGFLLIIILSFLSQKDESDYSSHLNRIKVFEKDFPFTRVSPKLIPSWIKGSILMPTAWVILYIYNIFIIIRAIGFYA